MRAWIEHDEQGQEILLRTGRGVVTAVAPVGIVAADGQHTYYRVEVGVEAPSSGARAIRYSVHPIVAADDPMFGQAVLAWDTSAPITWTAAWRRHDWVPGDLPITALNLVTDARCLLAELSLVPDTVEALVSEERP